MADDDTKQGHSGEQPPERQLDPARMRYLLQKLKQEQNLPLGIAAGTVAALAGAGLWALITVLTKLQIGWMAVGVGFLVGFSIRVVGKGIDKVFGYAGAVLSLFGCALGNLLAVCAVVSSQQGIPLMDVIDRLNPELVKELMLASFRPMDVLFYGIAVYQAYKLSFRRISQEELNRQMPG